jgi:hypothetical protein
VKVAEGTFGPLVTTETETVTVAGNWPEDETARFLIMEWENFEDITNTYKTTSTGGTTLSLPDIDYIISDLQATGAFYTGGSFSAQLSIYNDGPQNALPSDNWDWEVYMSTDNSTAILPGDVKIDDGFGEAPLDSGVVNEVTFSPLAATWPFDDGNYYLKARILNTRESAANTVNNIFVTAVPYNVPNASDYEMVSMTVPSEMDLLGDFGGGSFQYRDGASVTNSEPVYWKVYASGDRVLDADTGVPGDDYLVFEGVVNTPPSSGGSDTVNFGTGAPLDDIGAFAKGLYPYAGNMYLIAVISSSTDNDSSDNVIVSDRIDVLEGQGGVLDFVPDSYSGLLDSIPGVFLAAPDNNQANSVPIEQLDIGDEIVIRGASDFIDEVDTYHLVMGPGVESLYIRSEWSTGDDYDIYLWDGTESTYYELIDVGPDAEPFDSFLTIMDITGSVDWYLAMYFYDSSAPGAEYTLTLTASGP